MERAFDAAARELPNAAPSLTETALRAALSELLTGQSRAELAEIINRAISEHYSATDWTAMTTVVLDALSAALLGEG